MSVRAAVLILLIGGMSLASGSPVTASGPASDAAYVWREPIHIETDDEFTAANGVVSGDGTLEDPYVISGWKIDADGRGAITIGPQVTHSHFVIEGNHLSATEPVSRGISIGTSSAGVIRQNTINLDAFGTIGVLLGSVTASMILQPHVVENNTITAVGHSWTQGIRSYEAAYLASGNLFQGMEYGVYVSSYDPGVGHIILRNNDFENVSWGVERSTSIGVLPQSIDARDNYWGSADGPNLVVYDADLCFLYSVCTITVLETSGAKVSPDVLAYPYSATPHR